MAPTPTVRTILHWVHGPTVTRHIFITKRFIKIQTGSAGRSDRRQMRRGNDRRAWLFKPLDHLAAPRASRNSVPKQRHVGLEAGRRGRRQTGESYPEV
jgi:hypothetical protein